jgi:hypothetical protein
MVKMLKFIAARDTLVPVPGAAQSTGQAPKYINRMLVDAAFPAHSKPFEVKPTDPRASRLRRKCASGDLFPFDRETAAACGVPFVQRSLVDGEWAETQQAVRRPGKDEG